MAQIFVSHSKRDENLVNFFSKAFAPTKVRAIFEEFERILTGDITSNKVKQDIENSNAAFVILSKNVKDIPYTRDWIVWEAGIAKNKDIWVFEPFSQFGSISVVIPCVRHYVLFDENNDWLGYIRNIIESYDDSHVLGTALVTSLTGIGIGAGLSKDSRAGGAFIGGIGGTIAGLAMSDKSRKRPMGLSIMCIHCKSSYNVHIQGSDLRCPVCNKFLKISR